MTIGERLKKLREDEALSQKDLAQHLDMAPSLIANYEFDRVELSATALIKYSRYFDVISDYILGLLEHQFSGSELDD